MLKFCSLSNPSNPSKPDLKLVREAENEIFSFPEEVTVLWRRNVRMQILRREVSIMSLIAFGFYRVPNLHCNLILHLTAWMTKISNYPLDLINDSLWQRSLSDEVNELGASASASKNNGCIVHAVECTMHQLGWRWCWRGKIAWHAT